MLSDAESDTESLHQFTINEHYAKAFAYRKEREELERLKEKYGSDVSGDDFEEDETSESDSDDEDEDAEELTPAVDAAILRTLARIKKKDPAIYDTNQGIFEEEKSKVGSVPSRGTRVRKEKLKPVTMRQLVLESTLNPTSRSPSPQPITHVEEQRVLRDETIAAFHGAVDSQARQGSDRDEGDAEEDEDEDEDDLLIPREKTTDELMREEEEYRVFLEREVGDDLANLVTLEENTTVAKDEKEARQKKKRKDGHEKSASKEPSDQEFLMNYILNRGWIDRTAQRVPTYKEITDTKPSKKNKKSDFPFRGTDDTSHSGDDPADGDNASLAEDDFDDIVDRFESSYNFRFEEPDATVIKTFPRNLQSTVRREDTTRKEARERRKQRKEEEILKKKEELKRLKALKMKDLRGKLERIGREGGKNVEESEALQNLDLEGEWDAETHDQQMGRLYDSGDEQVDAEKPHWEDDIDIGDIISANQDATKKKKKKKKKKDRGEDEMDQGGVDIDEMDADVENVVDDEEWDGTEEMRKRKMDEYMDEIYGMDFNDIVGDLPTRFKYATVQPQSFSLTPVEILMAKDQDLNQYLSVKKYAPYKKGVRWDAQRGTRLKEFKQKLAERMNGTDGDDTQVGSGAPPLKKRKGKKERLKMRGAQEVVVRTEGDGGKEKESIGGKKKRKHDELAERTDESREEEKTKRIVKVGFDEKLGRDGAKLKGEHDEELVRREGGGEGGEAKKKRRRHKKGKTTHEQD